VTAVFFDTSALVKLLLDEAGTAIAREAWELAAPPVCCRLAFVEARAALAAAHRAGRLEAAQYRLARRRFADLVEQTAVVEVDEQLVWLAADLAETHALRGDDAVHLAAALTVGTGLMVSADADQVRAARAENLPSLDPASP
jgi:uncharacterized protein